MPRTCLDDVVQGDYTMTVMVPFTQSVINLNIIMMNMYYVWQFMILYVSRVFKMNVKYTTNYLWGICGGKNLYSNKCMK